MPTSTPSHETTTERALGRSFPSQPAADCRVLPLMTGLDAGLFALGGSAGALVPISTVVSFVVGSGGTSFVVEVAGDCASGGAEFVLKNFSKKPRRLPVHSSIKLSLL